MKNNYQTDEFSGEKFKRFAYANASMFPNLVAGRVLGKGEDGNPKGQRRSCFTGSDVLIGAIQEAEQRIPIINKDRESKGLPLLNLYPMDTTIVKVGKCFQFT